MNPFTIVAIAVTLIVVAIIFTTITWEIQEEETYFTYEPYNYEASFIRENQVRTGFLWIKEVTQVQYLLKNTDSLTGTFTLNFIFDNKLSTETITEHIDIPPGEIQIIVIDSPLNGYSTHTLNIIPPKKEIPQTRTVTRNVKIWEYLWRLIPLFK